MFIFPFLTLLSHIFTGVFLFLRLIGKADFLLSFFKKYAITFAFIISLAATAGSLFYSEVAGYEPCALCWYQRIFMFPQVLLFGVALWKNRRSVADYSLGLSLFGGIIALYHSYIQFTNNTTFFCPVGGSVSCAKRYVFEFGYITIPVMTLTAFLLLIGLMIIEKSKFHYDGRRRS